MKLRTRKHRSFLERGIYNLQLIIHLSDENQNSLVRPKQNQLNSCVNLQIPLSRGMERNGTKFQTKKILSRHTFFSFFYTQKHVFSGCVIGSETPCILNLKCALAIRLFSSTNVRASSKNSKARLSLRRVLEINSEFRWCRYLTKLSHFHSSAIKPVILFGNCSFAPRIILSRVRFQRESRSRFSP